MADLDKLEQARADVKEVYKQLMEVITPVITDMTGPLDEIVAELSKGINLYSNTELWDFQMRLSVEAYRLGILKEQNSLRASCAEALYKEGVARAFGEAVGAQEAKKQQAVIDTIDKQAVSMLYATVEGMLKTKCDEAHRLVSTIQNIQISRASEAKLSSSPRSEQDRLLME